MDSNPTDATYSLYLYQAIEESSSPNTQMGDRPFYDYLEGCLKREADMAVFEAARAMTELIAV